MTVEMEVKQKNGSEMGWKKKKHTQGKRVRKALLGPGGKNIWQEFLP